MSTPAERHQKIQQRYRKREKKRYCIQKLRDFVKEYPLALKRLDDIPFFHAKNPISLEAGWSSEIPKLIPVEDCFNESPPTHEELMRVLEVKSKTNSELRQCLQNFLADRDGTKSPPTTVWNIAVRGPKWSFKLPSEINQHITNTDHLKDTVMLNFGDDGAIVPFHIDIEMAAQSAVSGNVQKDWIFAEGSDRNFKILLKYQNHPNPFPLLLIELENTFIVQQTSSHVIHLFPGAIHATFNETGGILYGNNFISWQYTESIRKCLRYTLCNNAFDKKHKEEAIRVFCEAICYAIKHGNSSAREEALNSFYSEDIRPYIFTWKDKFKTVLKEIDKATKSSLCSSYPKLDFSQEIECDEYKPEQPVNPLGTIGAYNGQKSEVFECAPCKKTFTQKVAFNRHQRESHNTKKQYFLCTQCSKGFSRYETLGRHQLTHNVTDIERKHCPLCTKETSFSRLDALKRHLNKFHPGAIITDLV